MHIGGKKPPSASAAFPGTKFSPPSAQLMQYLENPVIEGHLRVLLSLSEKNRSDRAYERPCTNVNRHDDIESHQIRFSAECSGETQTYSPRITIGLAKRTYGCSCPDLQNRKGKFGPCKHVISLARKVWADQMHRNSE